MIITQEIRTIITTDIVTTVILPFFHFRLFQLDTPVLRLQTQHWLRLRCRIHLSHFQGLDLFSVRHDVPSVKQVTRTVNTVNDMVDTLTFQVKDLRLRLLSRFFETSSVWFWMALTLHFFAMAIALTSTESQCRGSFDRASLKLSKR